MNITESTLLVVAACNAAGLALKTSPIPNKWITLILPAIGSLLLMGLAGFSVNHGIQGFLAGWSAVGANQALRQLNGRGVDKPKPTGEQ